MHDYVRLNPAYGNAGEVWIATEAPTAIVETGDCTVILMGDRSVEVRESAKEVLDLMFRPLEL